jgi:hypothetical protein
MDIEKKKNIASTTAAEEATTIAHTLTATATATNTILYYRLHSHKKRR